MKSDSTIKNILWIILGAAAFLYLYNVFMASFNTSLLILVMSLILFTSLSLFFDVFDIKEFIIILSISGFILSLTIFFFYGIEEVPYPYGAIVFHFDGILKSLIIAFVSSIPLLILFKGDGTISNNNNSNLYRDNGWEVATEDDLDSGQFESY